MYKIFHRRHLVRHLAILFLATALAGCAAKSPVTRDSEPVYKYPFDQKRAFADLQKQCAFGPRNPGSAGHAKCLEWIKTEAAKTADKVFTQSFTRPFRGKNYIYTNVFAVYGVPAEKWIILCAHWDTRPFADQELDQTKAKQPILGANDGASGVAALLELGRMFKNKKPPYGVVIAYYDGEDFGKDPKDMFLGSAYFSKTWKQTMRLYTQKFEYGILLDMIGYKELLIPREAISQQAAPKLMDEIYAHAKSAGLSDAFPDEPGQSIQDDHVPMIAAGIPTVNIISFNYPYWHTLEDTPDKCSPASLKIVGEVVARTIYE